MQNVEGPLCGGAKCWWLVPLRVVLGPSTIKPLAFGLDGRGPATSSRSVISSEPDAQQ